MFQFFCNYSVEMHTHITICVYVCLFIYINMVFDARSICIQPQQTLEENEFQTKKKTQYPLVGVRRSIAYVIRTSLSDSARKYPRHRWKNTNSKGGAGCGAGLELQEAFFVQGEPGRKYSDGLINPIHRNNLTRND